jgi:tRNA A-37 threonylcarbamoyl transferase component Bud32
VVIMVVEVRHGVQTGAVLDGRYELRRALGQGSEGTVFEAVHRFTGQRHAVKVAAKEVPEGTDWKRVRLLREARALGQLRHPNIVAITDAGVVEGFPFVAMELLEGRSLEGLLATRGRLPVGDAVSAALQVCDALAAAHAVGVLHRDVKPGNVIVVREGDTERIKLVDFGTSKTTQPGAERLTAPGTLVGTPSYMAPEQLLAQDVDEGVDIYAVGAMLFECITGVVPYEGAYPRVLMAVCTADPPPSARLVRPQIEVNIDAVVRRALAKKRIDRFATVGELANALRAACPEADGKTRLLDIAPPVAVPPRRRFHRAPYRTPVRVMSKWGEVDGRCEDISEGGMLLLASQACEPNEEVSVRFALPIEGRVAACKARVQWVRARPDRPYASQAIGLEFLDIAPEHRASLARYVALMTGELTEPVEPMPVTFRSPTQSGEILIAQKSTIADSPVAIHHRAGTR